MRLGCYSVVFGLFLVLCSGPGGMAFGQGSGPVISEFLASNSSSLPLGAGEVLDEDGESSDWIELFNPSQETVDLSGWYLTDNPADLARWPIPEVQLSPFQFLIVFASGKDRRDPASELHTNFRLSSAAGFLALVRPDGQSMTSAYDYPDQQRDIAYGASMSGALQEEVLLSAGAGATAWIPTSDALGQLWTAPEFDDSAWQTGRTGIGYDYAGLIGLDTRPMRYAQTSVYARIGFDVTDVANLSRLVLRMKYEDGFVAYLNGVPVAQVNAPAADLLTWNSAASAQNSDSAAVRFEDFVLPLGALNALVPGRNVLAVHGLNVNLSSSDLLILPELRAQRSVDVDLNQQAEGYLSPPTPGVFNGPGAIDILHDVEFSVERGFFDTAFALELTTSAPDAEIRYTLDGSTPTPTKGQVYRGPLTINSTTVIRAAAFKPGYLASGVSTQSYIFVRDVVRQSPQGQAPGSGWPTGNVNGQAIDYGMDPDIVNDSRWADQIEAALLDIPSISLVTALDNLFGPSIGVYVNARNDGPAWERRTSVELLHPDGTEGFGVDAGLRIRGAFSRTNGNPKHSLRLFFRREYGAAKLRYPLFGGAGASEFDKIDLRTSQNNSWAFQGSAQNTLIRDVFSRDVQRDMRQPYTRSRYYHLYLNGHYWGLYQTQERADADFAESYLGGDADQYDVVKNDSSGSRALHATDGTMDAYRRLYDAAVRGFSSDAAYLAIQGLHPDGTVDPNGERLLHAENLMDYMICTYYTGDPDAPVSCWAHFSNNVFAIYNRIQPQGFTWYRHDAEHSLGANGGINEGRLLTDSTDRSIGQAWRHFNPAWLHVRLCEHPEYRLQFTDRVVRYMAHDGLLTAGSNIERWMARAEQIDLAIIAESARWGDADRHPPRTRNDWQGQNDYMVNSYFPGRTQIVINQMRSVNMFPRQAVVSFNQPGGEIKPGSQLLMSQSNGTPGTIYYTLDGSDPRIRGGAINPDAAVFEDETSAVAFISRGSVWRFLDNGSDQGAAWQALDFNDLAWKQGPAQLGYGDDDEATVVGYGPAANNKFPTTYFRRTFNVAQAAGLAELTLGLVRDDGAVVYINGVEAARVNLPSGDVNYLTWASGAGVPVGGADESAFHSLEIDPALLRDGVNVIAVEIHQGNATSSDISFDLELTGLVAGTASAPVLLNQSTTVKARAFGNGAWGALTEARFTVGLAGLVINEFMATNQETLVDPEEADEYPDWIEIYNGGAGAVELGGMFLTDELQDLSKWQIPAGVSISPGQHLLFFADSDDSQGAYHTNFRLRGIGEIVALIDRDGTTVVDSIAFEEQVPDVSLGRSPDGADAWVFFEEPTPGAAN